MSTGGKPSFGSFLLNPLSTQNVGVDSDRSENTGDTQEAPFKSKKDSVMTTEDEIDINQETASRVIDDKRELGLMSEQISNASGSNIDHNQEDLIESRDGVIIRTEKEIDITPGTGSCMLVDDSAVESSESEHCSLVTNSEPIMRKVSHRRHSKDDNDSTKISKVTKSLPMTEGRTCKKKTILPKNLLNNVTNLVKQQKVTLPQAKSIDGKLYFKEESENKSRATKSAVRSVNSASGIIKEKDSDCNTSIKAEGTGKSIDISAEESFTVDETKFEAGYDDEKGVEKAREMAVCGQTAEMNDLESKLLFSELVKDKEPGCKSDIVYDLSPMFTGQLDRKDKREKKGKRFRKTGETSSGKEKGMAGEARLKKQIPNFFMAIQIKNTQIHGALHEVQKEVLAGNRLLSPAMVNLAKLHLTLMVLRLENEEDIARSKCAMINLKEKLSAMYSDKKLHLSLCGIGNFGDEVVFAKLKDEEQEDELQQMRKIVEACFLDQGLATTDKRFNPHFTLMKMSDARHLRKKGIKKIDQKLYAAFKDTDFGVEDVKTIQLCEMKNSPTGYYHIEDEVQFIRDKPAVDYFDYFEDEEVKVKDEQL